MTEEQLKAREELRAAVLKDIDKFDMSLFLSAVDLHIVSDDQAAEYEFTCNSTFCIAGMGYLLWPGTREDHFEWSPLHLENICEKIGVRQNPFQFSTQRHDHSLFYVADWPINLGQRYFGAMRSRNIEELKKVFNEVLDYYTTEQELIKDNV